MVKTRPESLSDRVLKGAMRESSMAGEIFHIWTIGTFVVANSSPAHEFHILSVRSTTVSSWMPGVEEVERLKRYFAVIFRGRFIDDDNSSSLELISTGFWRRSESCPSEVPVSQEVTAVTPEAFEPEAGWSFEVRAVWRSSKLYSGSRRCRCRDARKSSDRNRRIFWICPTHAAVGAQHWD